MSYDLHGALRDLAVDPVADAHEPDLATVASRVRHVQLRRRGAYAATGVAVVAGIAVAATVLLPLQPTTTAPPAGTRPPVVEPVPTQDPTREPTPSGAWQPSTDWCGLPVPDVALTGLADAYVFRRPADTSVQLAADPTTPVPVTVDLVVNLEGMPDDVAPEEVDVRVVDVLAATWDAAASVYRVEAVAGSEPAGTARGAITGTQALAVTAGEVPLVSCAALTEGDGEATPPTGPGYELFVEVEVTGADGVSRTVLGRPGVHVGTAPEGAPFS